MKKYLLILLSLPSLVFAQTTTLINFDDPTKWNGGGAVSGYGAHTYVDGLFSMTSNKLFRETSASQDGFPGFNGTYAFRLRNEVDAWARFTIASGGVSTFNMEIRRWDGTPSPDFYIQYSTDGGTNWIQVATIDNTTLNNQSDFVNFSGTINSTASNILIEVSNVGAATVGERIMVDDFEWTDFTGGSTCDISASGLSSVSCNNNGTGALTTDDYITFDLNPSGINLSTNYEVSVSSGNITPSIAAYGAATSFQLQNGSAGAGNVTVTITDDTDGACTFDVVVVDPGVCSSVTPVITLTPSSLTGFDHQVGTPSAEQSFSASGISLTTDIVITAPADYEISETSGSGFTNSITLTQTGGTVAATTIYVRGNAASMGTINQEIVATSTGADNDTVFVSGYADDYVYYTIDEISTVDANGVADSNDVLVELTGVVYCMDFDGNAGYSITMIDGSGEGINVFSFNDVPNYTSPAAGDSLRVFGTIGQFNGLLQVEVDSIEVLAQGVELIDPVIVTVLDETTESQYITMENLTFVNPITTFGSNENLEVTDGVNTYILRIDGDTDLPGTPAPQVSFSVTGVGGQFDTSNPYNGSYQLFPCGTASIVPSCTMPVNTLSVTGTTATADATGVTYQWIDCSDDSAVSGATNASFTPTVSGDYAVILMDGECVDTSSCVTISLTSAATNTLSLEDMIAVYPNPVQDALTVTSYAAESLTVEVRSINGQVISTMEFVGNAILNTQSWTKGVYFIVFSNTSGQTHIERVIK